MMPSVNYGKITPKLTTTTLAVQKSGKPDQTKISKASRSCFWSRQEPSAEKPLPLIKKIKAPPPDPTEDSSLACSKDFRKTDFIRNDKVE